MPTCLQRADMSDGRSLFQRTEHRGHAALHVDAVVGVADRGVEVGEQLCVLTDPPGEFVDPSGQGGDVDGLVGPFSIPFAAPAC